MNLAMKIAIVLYASAIAVVAAPGSAGAELGSTTTVNGAAPPAGSCCYMPPDLTGPTG